jgi:hypothetical protein
MSGHGQGCGEYICDSFITAFGNVVGFFCCAFQSKDSSLDLGDDSKKIMLTMAFLGISVRFLEKQQSHQNTHARMMRWKYWVQ